MAITVNAVWSKAAAFADGWRRIAVLIVFVLAAGACAWSRRVGLRRSASAGRPPPVGQQLLDAAVQLRGQSGEHVLEVGPGLVPIELGRLQQAHHDSRALAGQLAADEEPVAPTQGPGPNSVLDVVVVDRHVAVQQVSAKPHPVLQAVVDRLGNCAAIGHAGALQFEPRMHFLPQGLGSLLTQLQPLLAAQSPGVSLDTVQPGDALDRLRGHGAGVRLEQLIEFTPGVGDAPGNFRGRENRLCRAAHRARRPRPPVSPLFAALRGFQRLSDAHRAYGPSRWACGLPAGLVALPGADRKPGSAGDHRPPGYRRRCG